MIMITHTHAPQASEQRALAVIAEEKRCAAEERAERLQEALRAARADVHGKTRELERTTLELESLKRGRNDRCVEIKEKEKK